MASVLCNQAWRGVTEPSAFNMASQQQGIPVTSSNVIQRKTVEEMIQEVSKRIQNFGPGPITPEQAQELEKLKSIYEKLLKSQGDVYVTHQNPGRIQVAMTTPTQGTLQQGVTSQQAITSVQRIVPAMPTNQVTTSQGLPGIPTTVTILPQGSSVPAKIHVTSPTTLTTAQIQQIQAQVLSQTQAHGQPQTVQVVSSQRANISAPITQQQQIVRGQVKVAAPNVGQTYIPGQRIISATPGSVSLGAGTTGLKQTQVPVQTSIKLTTQSPVVQSVPLHRQLAPNKIQGGINISTTQSTAAGVIPHIAPTVSAIPKSLVSHGGIANSVETPSPQPQQVLTKRRIQELLHEIDPQEQMDDDVEDLLLQIADDFIENIVNSSCQIAKHRKSNTLEVKDVQLHLERCWNMWIPGFGSDELRPYKKAASTEAHKQRMALIRKSLKK